MFFYTQEFIKFNNELRQTLIFYPGLPVNFGVFRVSGYLEFYVSV